MLPKLMLTKRLTRTSSEWALGILKYSYAIQRNIQTTSKVGNHFQVDIKAGTIITIKEIIITLDILTIIKVVMVKESILVEVVPMQVDMISILIQIDTKTDMVDTITEMTMEIMVITVDNNKVTTKSHTNLDMEKKVDQDTAMISMEINLATIRIADLTIITINMIQAKADTITVKEMITIVATNHMINQQLSSRITATLIHMYSINKTLLQPLVQLIHLNNKITNIMGSNINIQ